jgi:hypothetical protein
MPQQSPPPEYAFNSKIKKIYLQIPGGYPYKHESLGEAGKEPQEIGGNEFLGREEIVKTFTDILSSNVMRGVYLVTGYRGMGKTSFVKKVLRNLENNYKNHAGHAEAPKRVVPRDARPKLKSFTISLAQSQVKDIDILRHIVNKLTTSLEETDMYKQIKRFSFGNLMRWFFPILTCLVVGWTLVNNLARGFNAETLEKIWAPVYHIFIVLVLLTVSLSMGIERVFWWISSNAPLRRKIFAVVISWLLTTGALAYSIADPHHRLVIISLSLIVFLEALWFLLSKNNTYKQNGNKSLHDIYKTLKNLQDRSTSHVTKTDQIDNFISLPQLSWLNKNQKQYPIANPREIENELIEIIKDLKNYYQYIFVFDELDKLDQEIGYFNETSTNAQDKRLKPDDLRSRKQMVVSTLSSLKYFVNEAEAKFIFIAGREMFDASLADVSDRQSAIGSIFHRVIYVDSFLKDRSKSETTITGIGSLTEVYLKRVLFGNVTPKGSEGLSMSNEFFSLYYDLLLCPEKFKSSKSNLSDSAALSEQEAMKVIFVLYNFVNYLVYRSNGSPKKIKKILEDQIVLKSSEAINKKQSIVFGISDDEIKDNIETHFLYFSYYNQYKLGFTSYLFEPFLTKYGSFMKRYNDNTLVSVPFLIDNIIKFHPFAFSSYNLELLPELMATSATPITRPFVDELLTFLGENHLRRSDSGLFEYKFLDRTHNEITIISKWFEDEAAAFNFTLDETLAIKEHLIARIVELRLLHGKPYISENSVTSILFLNRLLGDAYFQDEEYQEAIISYQDALQILDREKLGDPAVLVSFITIKLKLGLTHEKIKSFDIALSHYYSVIKTSTELLINRNTLIYRDILNLVSQAHLAVLYIQDKLQDEVTLQKIKSSTNEFLKLSNAHPFDSAERNIQLSSFLNSIGSLQYYKNIVLPLAVKKAIDDDPMTQTSVNQKVSSCFSEIFHTDFINESWKDLAVFKNPKKYTSDDARFSFATYLSYKLSLKLAIGTEENTLPKILFEAAKIISFSDVQSSTPHSTSNNKGFFNVRNLRVIGQSLSNITDLLLPLMQENVAPHVSGKELKEVRNKGIGCFNYEPTYHNVDQAKKELHRFLESWSTNSYFRTPKRLNPRFFINTYFMSSAFYLEAGDKPTAAFQLRKCLYVLQLTKFGRNIPKDDISKLFKYLEANLIRRLLELSSSMTHTSDRPQLKKFKNIFKIHTARTPLDKSAELYSSLSNSPESRETILTYAKFKVKLLDFNSLKGKNLIEKYQSIPESKLISPYQNVSHQITRLLEFELNGIINKRLLESHIYQQVGLHLSTIFLKKASNLLVILFSRITKNEDFSALQQTLKKIKEHSNTKYHRSTLYSRGAPPSHYRNFRKTKRQSSTSRIRLAKLLQTKDRLEKKIMENCRQTGKDFFKYWLDEGIYLTNLFPLKSGNPYLGNIAPHSNGTQAGGLILFLNTIAHKSNLTSKNSQWLIDYQQLICNSIFNQVMIKRIINTYDNNYVMSYSYLADAHRYLGFWCKHLQLCKILGTLSKRHLLQDTDAILSDLIGSHDATTLDVLTEYQMAVDNYNQALRMHKEGAVYRSDMKNMIYLEDDYNDNLYHFGAAAERFKINREHIRNHISDIERDLHRANRYKYNTFIGR